MEFLLGRLLLLVRGDFAGLGDPVLSSLWSVFFGIAAYAGQANRGRGAGQIDCFEDI